MNLGFIITFFVIFLIIELIIGFVLIRKIFKYHSLTLKDTFIYPILILLTALVVLSGLSIYSEVSFWKNVLTSLKDSVDVVKLSIDQSLVENLQANEIRGKLMLINYYGTYIISLMALISLSVSLLKAATKNLFKVFKRNFQDEITFVLGFNNDAKNFIRSLKFEKRKNVIFVLDSSKLDKFVDEKFFLEKYKITYVSAPYSCEDEMIKSLKKLIFGRWWNLIQIIRYVKTKKNMIQYNVITFFDDDAKNISFVNAAKKFIYENECYGGFYFEKPLDNKISVGEFYCVNTDIKYPMANGTLPVAYNLDKNIYIFKATEPSDKLEIKESDGDYYKDNLVSIYNINKEEFNSKINQSRYIKIDDNSNVKLLKFKDIKEFTFNITCDSVQQSLLDKIIFADEISYLLNKEEFNGVPPLIINDESNNQFIGKLVNSKMEEKNIADFSFGLIRTYNKYEIISFDFIKKYSLASFIDHTNIDNCTLKDCDINLYVLGYGRINQILLRDILICNSFVIKDNEGKKFNLKTKRINVKIYDKNRNTENLALSNAFTKYNKESYAENKYYPLIDNYLSYPDDFDLGVEISDFEFLKKIYNDINEKIQNQEKGKIRKQYNFFIISLDTDSKNWSLASTMQEDLKVLEENAKNIFFVRTTYQDYMYGNKSYFLDKGIYGFGVESIETNGKKKEHDNVEIESALSYDNIINQKLVINAKRTNINYELGIYNANIDNSYINNSYVMVDRFKQKSNVYSVMGLYSKFNLLFPDIKSMNKEDIKLNEELFVNKEDISGNHFVGSKEYKTRDMLAFIEHERWNAFEIAFGAMPLKKDVAKIKGTKIDNTYHLCITTCEGLAQIDNDNYGNYMKYDYDIINYFTKNEDEFNKFKNEIIL